MKQRAQRMFIVFFLLLFLGTAALIAFLLGVAYQEKQRQAEVNARNVVEALEATLRRSQATLEELARTLPRQLSCHWRCAMDTPGPCKEIWPCGPATFRRLSDCA
jgi:type II secretory pathway pseudopilin PulG